MLPYRAGRFGFLAARAWQDPPPAPSITVVAIRIALPHAYAYTCFVVDAFAVDGDSPPWRV